MPNQTCSKSRPCQHWVKLPLLFFQCQDFKDSDKSFNKLLSQLVTTCHNKKLHWTLSLPFRVSRRSLPCTSTTAVAFDLRRPQTTCISASYSGNLPKTFFIVTLSLINRCLRILFRTLNHQYDYTFDWTMLKQKAAASAAVGGTVAPVAPPAMPGPR